MREIYGLYLAYEYYPSEEQVYRVSSSMCRTTYWTHCPMRISGFTAAPSSGIADCRQRPLEKTRRAPRIWPARAKKWQAGPPRIDALPHWA